MPPDILPALAQLGAAGLIGWMWLTERRSAAERERQLTAAHDRILHERESLGTLIGALNGNTRALTLLEAGQRELAAAVRHLDTVRSSRMESGEAGHERVA